MENQLSILKELEGALEELEFNNEAPTERQINALLFNMDYSHLPDQIRKYIELNIDSVDLLEYYKLWGVIESFTPVNDPRKQNVNHWQAQKL